MAGQLLQGGNVFEITDYTTASDWERFIAAIEEVLTEWKLNKQSECNQHANEELPKGFISSGLWHERIDVVKFGNVPFDIRYQYLVDPKSHRTSMIQDERKKSPSSGAERENDQESVHSEASSEFQDASEHQIGSVPKQKEREYGEYELPDTMPECLIDLMSTANDFASKAHCLVRWYNLRRFIVMAPRVDTIISEDRLKLVLSSASIALSSIDCHIPIFIQTHKPKNNVFHGISEHFNIRTMYDMIFSRRGSNQYAYLSELIDLFREKTGCNLNDPISVSIRLNYCLDMFDLFPDPKQKYQEDEYLENVKDEPMKNNSAEVKKSQVKLPLKQDMRSGATFEMVREALDHCLPHPYKILKYLHVAALWPPISDKVINDSRVHSDLDPLEAPIWTMRCVTIDNCNMKIVHETQVVYELLSAAIKYAYDKLDAEQIFTNCDRDELESDCMKLSYDLATQPEVTLSSDPSDSLRKLIALLFFRATELRAEMQDPEVITRESDLPSLSEIYRCFNKNKPSVKEFIIRTNISRPFNPTITPALPQRMFCTVCEDEFRLCGSFSELCN